MACTMSKCSYVIESSCINFKIMTRYLFSLLLILLIFPSVKSQDFPTYLKENAVKIEKLDSLSSEVYKLISDNQLIMVGEMHGTNEPAKLVIGLAKLLTINGDTIQVGFEIPSSQMTNFINEHSENSIYSSEFFSKVSEDGRASVAWAEAISTLNKNPKVKTFFYDINNGDSKNIDDRDSIMYLKIKNKIREHPAWKMITISGNVHNMLLPYKGKNKMALYLSNDKDLNISDKICSLNHQYQSGTMNNNAGNEFKIHDVGNIESEYSRYIDYDNYLFLFPINVTVSYSGIFFTRTVTAAKLAISK